MRDVVGDIAQAPHQFADPLQHRVEITSEAIEFVARARDGEPSVEVAGHDPARGLGHRIDALEDAAGDEPGARHPEQHHEPHRGAEGPPDHEAQAIPLLHVAPDQQAKAARQHEDLHNRAVVEGLGLAVANVAGLRLARIHEETGGQRLDIADDAFARRVGHEVEGGAGLTGTPLNGGNQATQAPDLVLLG